MKRIALNICYVIILVFSSAVFATTYYVNGTTGDDDNNGFYQEPGSFPDGPKKTIQAGIDAATGGDTVQVADGTYTGDGNRDLDFSNGLPPDQTRTITVQSENGAGNCIIDCEGTEIDPHRGFYFDTGEGTDSVVDGFTITNGWVGEYGGGIRCDASSPRIIDCAILGNKAIHYGGGIYCRYSSNAEITNCIISGNTAELNGGGIYCREYSSAIITNCTITGNIAKRFGAGIMCRNNSSPQITGCTISENYVPMNKVDSRSGGGGISCWEYCNPTISNCIISNNMAMAAKDLDAGGGGISCWGDCYPVIKNCIFIGNRTNQSGGGIFYRFNSGPTIINCTFTENRADRGGAIAHLESSPAITNCILWGNSPEEIYYESDIPELNYCNIEGGWTGNGSNNISDDPLLTPDRHLQAGSPCIGSGTNTGAPANDIDGETRPYPGGGTCDIGADEFVDTDSDGLPDWWELKYFSHHQAANPEVDEEPDDLTNLGEYENGTDPNEDDVDGDGRVDGTEVADETNAFHPDNAEKTYYVNGTTGNDSNDGLTPGTAKKTIQAGIDATITGWDYAVEVFDGTYTGTGNRDLDFGGKAITVKSTNGAVQTIIDCGNSGRGFYFHSYELSDSVLEGFTIQNGEAIRGGGIYCLWSSPTITDSTITENMATTRSGGGISCEEYSSPRISDCEISGNIGRDRSGGGIACVTSSHPEISNCKIKNNEAKGLEGPGHGNGGGISCYSDCSPGITNCTITENTVKFSGGGINCDTSCSPMITNCTISSNTATISDENAHGGGVSCKGNSNARITSCTISGNEGVFGGGIYCVNSNPIITDCVISGNKADFGGGIRSGNYSSPTITDCTISVNEADEGGGISCGQYSSPTVTNCRINGNWACIFGGGIICEEYSSPTITNCAISGNRADLRGGGIYCQPDSSPTFSNCTISGNEANNYGGGIYCQPDSSPTFSNCTISGNEANNYSGGGVYCMYDSMLTITNCILWGNIPDEIYNASLSTDITYSDIQGGTGNLWFGTGCIDQDPLFVSGPLHNFYLSQVASGQDDDSPCVDAGSDTAVNLDLDDYVTRTDGIPDTGTVDMGYHVPYMLLIDSITKNGDDITIHWNAKPGVSYVVEYSESAEFATHTDVNVGEVTEWMDIDGGVSSQRYYRVREE